MKKIALAAFLPSARGMVRGLRFCAAAVALHGMLLWLSTASKSFFPNAFDVAEGFIFWALAAPALLLASPFASILWDLGLMNAPGWLAWPKPLGIALAYLVWIAVLSGLAQAVQWWSNKN